MIHFATAALMVVIAVVQIRRDGGWANTMSDLRLPTSTQVRER